MLLLLSCFCIFHRQPTRLPRPWDSPGKNTGVGCHFLLQCTKVQREREVTQSCPTLCDPTDCSPPGSSIHGIFQARVLEWGAIAKLNSGQCNRYFLPYLENAYAFITSYFISYEMILLVCDHAKFETSIRVSSCNS